MWMLVKPAGTTNVCSLPVYEKVVTHASAAGLGDRLAGADDGADANQRRSGVAVIDVAAGIGAAGDPQDGRVGPEAAEPLGDDGAVGDRDLDDPAAAVATVGGNVDALVQRPGARPGDLGLRPQRKHPSGGARADPAPRALRRAQRGGGPR